MPRWVCSEKRLFTSAVVFIFSLENSPWQLTLENLLTSLNKRATWAYGAIVVKSCHLRHVFSGYENKRTLHKSGLGLLAKNYEKNPSYGRTIKYARQHGALSSTSSWHKNIGLSDKLVSVFVFVSFVARRKHLWSKSLKNSSKKMFSFI